MTEKQSMFLYRCNTPPDTVRLLSGQMSRRAGLTNGEIEELKENRSNHFMDRLSKLLEMVIRKAVRKIHQNIGHNSDF